jgi:hypothetical protein
VSKNIPIFSEKEFSFVVMSYTQSLFELLQDGVLDTDQELFVKSRNTICGTHTFYPIRD